MTIQLDKLEKRFGGATVLREISAQIGPGEIIAVLGVNGAGKTTLMRLLSGLLSPSKGLIKYGGIEFTRKRIDLRKRLFFLPDFPVVYASWCPIQHLGMVLNLYDKKQTPELETHLVDLLRSLDLISVADYPMQLLSRGQIYKAALAGCLAVDAEVWLLDEPFASGMDPAGLQVLRDEARNAAARGRTIIYTTQLLEVAERFCTKAAVINRGKLLAYGPPGEIRSASGKTGLEELFRQLKDARRDL